MKIIYAFLSLVFLSACASAYLPTAKPTTPLAFHKPIQKAGEVFYPNYRMPQKPYFEMGIFEIEKPLSLGKPDNFLPQQLRTQKFDGAIVIDRHRYWDYVGELSIEKELISYVGIVYEENVRKASWLSEVKVQRYVHENLLDTVTIKLDMLGQITDVSGSKTLFDFSAPIQPWYFLMQKGPTWLEKSSDSWPSIRNQLTYNYARTWQFRKSENLINYRYWFGDYSMWELSLEDLGTELLIKKVGYDEVLEEVESLFLVDRLKKQIWHRPTQYQKIVFTYFYSSITEQNQYVLVQP